MRNNRYYWRLYEPIGCRDEYTKQLFERYGIKAYLSKCLSLIFDKSHAKRKGIYLVDINSCKYIPKINNQFVNSIPFNIVDRIEHDIDEKYSNDFDYKIRKANTLLEVYRKAELVITSRLHCALPCRAFGTPVIFVHDHYKENKRFSGLYKELNGSDGSIPCSELDPNINYEVIESVQKSLMQDITNRIRKLPFCFDE